MAVYDPWSPGAGFRVGAGPLGLVARTIELAATMRQVCRGFRACVPWPVEWTVGGVACTTQRWSRQVGDVTTVYEPREVTIDGIVCPVERAVWAERSGVWSVDRLARAAARAGSVDVVAQLAPRMSDDAPTWQLVGTAAAIAGRWDIVHGASGRCELPPGVLAAAYRAGHVVDPHRFTRLGDVVGPIVGPDRQREWLSGLPDDRASLEACITASSPLEFIAMACTDWPFCGAPYTSVTTGSVIYLPRSHDFVTDVRPLGDYMVELRINGRTMPFGPDTLIPSAYLMHGITVCRDRGEIVAEWGISYTGVYAKDRVAITQPEIMTDGDRVYWRYIYYGTVAESLDRDMVYCAEGAAVNPREIDDPAWRVY